MKKNKTKSKKEIGWWLDYTLKRGKKKKRTKENKKKEKGGKIFYIHLNQAVSSKVGDLVEGDQKASFSIATTPKCRKDRYSFPWIAPPYPW